MASRLQKNKKTKRTKGIAINWQLCVVRSVSLLARCRRHSFFMDVVFVSTLAALPQALFVSGAFVFAALPRCRRRFLVLWKLFLLNLCPDAAGAFRGFFF